MSMDRNDITKIGANISKYRKMKKYTQKQLGEYLDINSKTISKWENGTVAPDITVLNSLANVLGITIEELLSGVSTTNKKKRVNIIINFALTILLIVFILLSSYLYFNKWEVYDFSSEHEMFNVHGYVVTNGEESRYVINEMNYRLKKRDDIKISSVIVELYSGDELVNVYSNDFDKMITIEDVIPLIENNFGSGDINSVDYENFKFILKYENSSSDDIKSYVIDLRFSNR